MAEGSKGLVSDGSGAFCFQETCDRLCRFCLHTHFDKESFNFRTVDFFFFFAYLKKMFFSN